MNSKYNPIECYPSALNRNMVRASPCRPAGCEDRFHGAWASCSASRNAAGHLALPVPQYPDIVPPQVSVTTADPGANAGVVEATVAQPIEAQVVGVDKMIYMKSVSSVPILETS